MCPEGQDDKLSQRDRFIEAARQLGTDHDEETLDRVLGKVAPPVLPRQPQSHKVEDTPE